MAESQVSSQDNNTNSLADPLFIEAMRSAAYLANYITKFINAGYPVPTYYEKVDSNLKYLTKPNLIYPIGNSTFVHINAYTQNGDGFTDYEILMPPAPDLKIVAAVDKLFAVEAGTDPPPEGYAARVERIDAFLKRICVMSPTPVKYDTDVKNKKTLTVYEPDYIGLRYHFMRRRIGAGLLEPFLMDPYLEDISVAGAGNVYIVHKIFGSLRAPVNLTEDEIDDLIIGLSEQFGKTVSHSRPVIDTSLPDGSRINIIFGRDVSRKGTNATIRKFAKVPLSITQIVSSKTLDAREAAYMWMMLGEGMSVFICGETASGKTTTMTGISAFIPSTWKIVSIEDTQEITLPHPNWVNELTRDTGNPHSSVTMFDLLKAALRQRPNYILVGEIRGAEGNVAFQAMQSVSGDTPVLVRESGVVRFERIRDLIDKYFDNKDQNGKRIVDGPLEILSLTRDYKVQFRPVRYVIRHRAKSIYKLVHQGGVVRTTASHSVFVINGDGQIVAKPVCDIVKGEFLVSFSCSSNDKDNTKSRLMDISNSIQKIQKEKVDQLTTSLQSENEVSINAPFHYISLQRHIRENNSHDNRKIIIHSAVISNILKTEIENNQQILSQVELSGIECGNSDIANNLSYQARFNGDDKSGTDRYQSMWIERICGSISKNTNEDHDKRKISAPGLLIDASGNLIPFSPFRKLQTTFKVTLPAEFEHLFNSSNDTISKQSALKLLDWFVVNGITKDRTASWIVNNLFRLVKGNVVCSQVCDITLEDFDDFVYDVSVPGTESFFGGEYPILLHNTGHPVMSTFHAASVPSLIQRVTGNPINVPKSHVDNLNIGLFQSAVQGKDGRMVRRVMSINEIVGYSAAADNVMFIPVFNWDPSTDSVVYRGKGSSSLFLTKILLKRGMSRKDEGLLYEELDIRTKIIEKMIKDKMFNYFDVYNRIAKIREIGLEAYVKDGGI